MFQIRLFGLGNNRDPIEGRRRGDLLFKSSRINKLIIVKYKVMAGRILKRGSALYYHVSTRLYVQRKRPSIFGISEENGEFATPSSAKKGDRVVFKGGLCCRREGMVGRVRWMVAKKEVLSSG